MKEYAKRFAVSRLTALIITGCLFLSTGGVFAQPGPAGHHGSRQQGFTGQSGFGNGAAGSYIQGLPVMTDRPVTINEAKNLPHDSWVVITGNIINVLQGGRQYTFRDSTGEIAVDIGPKEWRGLSVDVSDKVEIHGEVKSRRGLIHIKVHAIRKGA